MSKVLVDRELLERVEQWVQEDCTALEELQAVLAQPAEAEGVRDYRAEFAEGEVEAGTAIDELQTALSAVTAERDRLREEMGILWNRIDKFESQSHGITALAEIERLRAEVEALREAFGECIQSLHDEMLQFYGGQKPDDMHPVTRRNYDRDMAEIAEYRAAMAAKEG